VRIHGECNEDAAAQRLSADAHRAIASMGSFPHFFPSPSLDDRHPLQMGAILHRPAGSEGRESKMPVTGERSRTMAKSMILYTVLVLGLLVMSGDSFAQTGVGTAFTYQGELRYQGNAATGQFDFRFTLHDALTLGSPVGGPPVELPDVTVTSGAFAANLDFGAEGVFNGEARWLEIEVRVNGGGEYTLLEPRQELTAAPYALALPGLWTEQNDESPNIVGGYFQNMVDPTVIGATISGGGSPYDSLGYPNPQPNMIYSDYGTIGGGMNNSVGFPGRGNGTGATVGGGSGNTAEGDYATVAGGKDNHANGKACSIAGGQENVINGYRSTIGAGIRNQIDGDTSVICAGGGNLIQSNHCLISAGYDNVIGDYASYSAIICGAESSVNNWFSLAIGFSVQVDRENTVCMFDGDPSMDPIGSLWINRDSEDGDPGDHPIVVGTEGHANGNGVYLDVNGNWSSSSSRTFKTDFEEIDQAELLERLRALPVDSWRYKNGEARHIGPCAEDFYQVFERTEQGTRAEKYLAPFDVAGVAVAGVKALDEIACEQDLRIGELEDRIRELEILVARGDALAGSSNTAATGYKACTGLAAMAALGLAWRAFSGRRGGAK